jgi:lysozyme
MYNKLRKADIEMIKRHEGYSSIWYKDDGGVATVGYGHTGPLPEGFTPPLDKKMAEQLLLIDLTKYESAVNTLVKAPLTPNQYAALVSFCYNVGIGALENSSLLRKLNAMDIPGAAAELLRWNKDNGLEIAGLTNRRLCERELFMKGYTDVA